MSHDAPATLAHVTGLVQSALDDADDPKVSATAVARKALRIARLRNDWEAVMWLQAEMRPPGEDQAKVRVAVEVGQHFTEEDFKALWRRTSEAYIATRTIDGSKMLGQSLPEVEAAIPRLLQQIELLAPPTSGVEPLSLQDYDEIESQRTQGILAVSEREQIIARIRQRVADYLSQTERQLLFGQVNADVWERNRRFVDQTMQNVAPEALEQFAAAYQRQAEGSAEARAHALTSCRRLLKTLADALYPATGDTVEGIDGRERKMTDDKFVSRLTQYVTDKVQGSASRELLSSQVRELGQRLDALSSLASKGVHASVSQAEVDHCLIQTYLTVGDLLRISAGTSAALAA